jgi:hypothetical protein
MEQTEIVYSTAELQLLWVLITVYSSEMGSNPPNSYREDQIQTA